jgi:hypothetical protein
MNKLIEMSNEIRSSKKFSRLGETYVISIIEEFLKKDKKLAKSFIEGPIKTKTYKEFLKDVKKFLHETYSVYQVREGAKKKQIYSLMKRTTNKEKLLELHEEMLHLHSSSRERKKDYETIYRNIFSVCGEPKKIFDIGCGMNAFSLPFAGIGCDAVEEDISLIAEYLKNVGKVLGFKGRSFLVNAFDKKFLVDISKVKSDVCFVFKMLDVFDYGVKHHKKSEEILKNINSKFLVVSFPTKTISNKKMSRPRRKWFEVMCDRLNWNFDYFETSNECFYVVKK